MSGQSEYSRSPWKGEGEINKLNTLPNEGTVFSKVKFSVLELDIPVPDMLTMLRSVTKESIESFRADTSCSSGIRVM